MALSFALHPHMTQSVHHLGLRLMSSSLLVATFPWTLQSGGWRLLLLDPPRTILPGASRDISPDDPVLGVVAAPLCSDTDDPVWGVWPHFLADPVIKCCGRSFLHCLE